MTSDASSKTDEGMAEEVLVSSQNYKVSAIRAFLQSHSGFRSWCCLTLVQTVLKQEFSGRSFHHSLVRHRCRISRVSSLRTQCTVWAATHQVIVVFRDVRGSKKRCVNSYQSAVYGLVGQVQRCRHPRAQWKSLLFSSSLLALLPLPAEKTSVNLGWSNTWVLSWLCARIGEASATWS